MSYTNNLVRDSYFITGSRIVSVNRERIQSRRKKRKIKINDSKIVSITRGDIVAATYWNKSMAYKFDGIVIAVRKKKFFDANCSFIVRNIIFRVGMEAILCFYSSRTFLMRTMDYKRKRFWYRKSKLYYLRHKANRSSRVI